MGYVAGGNMRTGGGAVGLLVIEEDIGLVCAQELRLVQAAQEYGLVYTDIPGP